MNLPLKIEMSELMTKVRGGAVVSCQLLNTISISSSLSALVQFLHEKDALAYEEFAAAHPIYFADQRAHVKLIQTPSWPVMLLDQQHTRCLKIYNFPTTIKQAQLRCDLRVHRASRITTIENIRMYQGQVLEIRFSSIKHAQNSYDILITNRAYKQCRIVFSSDPCTRPLEILMHDDDRAADDNMLNVACEEDDPVKAEVRKLGDPTSLAASLALPKINSFSGHTKNSLLQSRWASGRPTVKEE